MRTSAILASLDAATRAHHLAADEPWTALMTRDVSPQQYLHHLVAIYGFEAPLESALALTPRLPLVIDLRERARIGWLVQDLLLLGLRPAKIARLPQCSMVVPFRDPAEALGWLYVVDRTTVHRDPLREHFVDVLPTAPVAYLSAPPIDPDALATALDQVASEASVMARVIAVAHAAFDCHEEWFANDVRLSAPNLAIA